ncbi:DUF2690 domain-containing protein [Streptomyces sp. NPDC002676]
MPRWKALPDDLDPQIKEFIGELRLLVDRSGLNPATLADRTGYAKTSWERYLGGELLAPKGAAVALAEVTGTGPVHLTTLWELAERSWNRAEARHDTTMQALRISQAGAAPGEFGQAGGASGSGGVPDPYDGGARPPRPGAGTASANRHRVTMLLASLAGVLVIIAGVFFFTRQGSGEKHERAATPPPSSPSPAATHPALPAGVKCAHSACTGKDAEAMGCSGELVTTAKTATIGTVTLEVRYSRTCGAAWGRITDASPGDTVQLSVGTVRERGDIAGAGDTIAYTPMVAVRDAGAARACATLADGRTGCTR